MLLPEWKDVAKKSWAFWLAIITGLLSAAEVILPMYVDAMPRGRFATLSMVTAVMSAVARLIYQKSLNDK